MKMVLYYLLLIFSILMMIGGIGVMSETGVDIVSIIMLFAFLCLTILSITKISKINRRRQNIKENKSVNKQKNTSAYRKNKEDTLIQSESISVDNESKHSEGSDNKNEGSNEDEDLKRQNELLKMKLDLKEKYIKEIETKKTNISRSKKQSYDIQHIENSENISEKNYEVSLDLTYTKAKKLVPNFVVLDFETTGLKYQENEIIQYGVVEYQEGKVINEHSKYFKPNKPIGKTVMRKTGITNEFLEDKPKLSEVYMEELKNLLEGKTIVAHNAPFDLKFLLKNLCDFNIEHKKFRVFDTLTYARRLIDETPNHKLETLKNHFGLDDGLSHNALNDCRATGNLALMLMNRMNK
ncbi:exonuclease domain-containing protein [Staphylococcus equorum]|uniref:3'-5' exonuclease n=1 Tax=Staphylococcus equorum TaxID=246432 RepID=UPI003CF6B3EB